VRVVVGTRCGNRHDVGGSIEVRIDQTCSVSETVVAGVQHLNGPKCLDYIPATDWYSFTQIGSRRMLCDDGECGMWLLPT
jgi:hypothetical protein